MLHKHHPMGSRVSRALILKLRNYRGPPRGRRYDSIVPVRSVTPQLVANDGVHALRAAIADPDAYAIEPKVDGVRLLLTFHPDRTLETRNRRGVRRDWLRGDAFEDGLGALAARLPILWRGTVLDGELTAGRFQWTMAAILGSKR